MDEFAQTRGADDLFDDDFTPITEPEPQIQQPAVEPLHSQKPPPQQYPHEQIPRGPKNGPRAAPTQAPRRPSQAPSSHPKPAAVTSTTTTNTTSVTTTNDESNDTTAAAAAAPQPSTSAESTAPRPPRTVGAVRGDRLATGGTPKPKLTEEELSAKLAAAKINSEKRAEAHRLAEADEASFQQREAKATERRKEEGKARRVMDMEREKNRLRKLEAGKRGGREWDEGKEEEEKKRDMERGGGGYRRGANGAVSGGTGGSRGARYPSASYIGEEDGRDYPGRGGGFTGRGRGRGRGEGRGQGDRGRGGGPRDRGGGNIAMGTGYTEQKAPDPSLDFPALPTGPKSKTEESVGPSQANDLLQSPVTNGASWADQVNDKDA